ncbi:EF0163 family protein [Enterococcus wangshanyuanii]|uniref:Lipoprotein n=1 Tax=Enterococcus wangshanyuanii TaxID=2005703 RepID=A0ABQ1PCV1_9ENTE|nr:EF0163 family protein [Enterococcus wangshanyuanii]GGC94713.1 lipoprotein [Enterococcus wangshanyuanii]
MKKLVFLFLSTLLLVGISGCKKEAKQPKTIESSSVSMKQVEDQVKYNEKTDDSIEMSSSIEKTEEKKKKVNVKALLEDFGDAYANYEGISDRNEKLKRLMTKKCIEANGINFDSAVMMISEGEVKSIYQPIEGEKDQYAIYLVCKQNGSEVRVLLLVKITGDKVSEMTYNTVRQEY